jgi:hypothetical protein
MVNPRTSRELDTREKNPTRYVYTPVSALPDPTPEPGYKFHYCAATVLGNENPTNMSQKFREGWVPVKAVDHPELQIAGNKDGNVEVGGLILCKAPEEMVVGRQEYYARAAQNQMDSVDNHFLRNNDARMPLLAPERKSSVTRGGTGFGNGSK